MKKEEIMKEVFGLIEDVLDTLIEVGNGTTDEMLHEAADELFRVRDLLKKTVKDQEQEESEMEMRIIGVSRDHRELICSNGFRVVSGNGEFDVETMNQQLEEAGLPPLKEINPEPLIHGEYLDNMAAQYGITRDGRSDADLSDAILKRREEIEYDSQYQNHDAKKRGNTEVKANADNDNR